MSYEVTTIPLKKVTDGLLNIFDNAVEGKADIEQGKLAVNAGGKITQAIKADVKVRLASDKLKAV